MNLCRTLIVPLLLSGFAVVEVNADEAAIRKFVSEYVDAFNNQDLDSSSAMWAENGRHVDRGTGVRTEGRAGIRADLAEAFDSPAKTHLAGTVDQVRFITADVASVEGTTTTSVPNEDPSVSQFTAVLVKNGDDWKIDSIEEMPVPQPAKAYDALRELDWLVGTWVDESKDLPVVSTLRWSENGSFLIRSFSTGSGEQVTRLGTQIIGWDPRSKQIRSWMFNSDGSFGDGVWTKTDDEWSIKSTQTLADGRAASGTYVITPVDADRLELRLIGHEIEGEPVPTSDPIAIFRQPSATKEPSKPAK